MKVVWNAAALARAGQAVEPFCFLISFFSCLETLFSKRVPAFLQWVEENPEAESTPFPLLIASFFLSLHLRFFRGGNSCQSTLTQTQHSEPHPSPGAPPVCTEVQGQRPQSTGTGNGPPGPATLPVPSSSSPVLMGEEEECSFCFLASPCTNKHGPSPTGTAQLLWCSSLENQTKQTRIFLFLGSVSIITRGFPDLLKVKY